MITIVLVDKVVDKVVDKWWITFLPKMDMCSQTNQPPQKLSTTLECSLWQALSEGLKKLSTFYPPLIHQVIHHPSKSRYLLLQWLLSMRNQSYPPLLASPIIIIFI